jgi:hypothetical protein
MRNIKNAEVDDIVIPIVKTSEEAERNWKELIEFLWIDGAHEYDLVKLDFEKWVPHLIEGGIIAFHDTTGWLWPGPKRVVEEEILRSKIFSDIGLIGSITLAKKVNNNSMADRLKSRYVMFLKNAYEYASKLQLPKPAKTIRKKIVKLATTFQIQVC